MRDGPVGAAFLWSVRLLTLVAAAIAGYLLFQSLTGAAIAGCGPGSGCGEVLSSRWASWFGVPVSAGGLALYLTMFLASFLVPDTKSWDAQRAGWCVLLAAAALELAAAAWFIAVQAIDLYAFCPWCLTAHALSAAAAILILLRAPISSRFDPESDQATLKPGPAAGAMSIGLLCVGAIIAGQFAYIPDGLQTGSELLADNDEPPLVTSTEPLARSAPVAESFTTPPRPGPPTNPMQSVSPPVPLVTTEPDASSADPPPLNESPREKRIIRVLRTTADPVGLAIDVYDVPVMGSPDAPQYMVKLFDYTCSACRNLHDMLERTKPYFTDSMVVVLLPTPMLHDCNPLVPDRPNLREAHGEACGVARAALAVWRADRSKFDAFHQWAFSENWPPTIERAREKGAQLVGREAFDRSWDDPWIDRQFEHDVRYYKAAGVATRSPNLPKLIFERLAATGVPRTEQEMLQYLSERARIRLSVPPDTP